MAIALAVLFIACANFVNLSTSQSEKRARETGLRKIAGAGRFQLTCMFVGEAVTLALISVFFATNLSKLVLPWFNELSQRNMSIDFSDPKVLISVLLFAIITGILSGIYPALLFSKYQPVQILHKQITPNRNKTGLRKGFIIAQFLITILLITSQLFITRQISFMKNHELGFNPDNLVSVPLYVKDENNRLAFARLFADNLEREASDKIAGTTITENVPGRNFPNRFAIIPEGSSPDDSREMVVTSIDENYSGVFQIPLVSGRILTDTVSSDRFNNALINEAAAKKLGWDDPIGKKIRFKHETEPLTVVGVIKDINFRSLQSPIEPVVYRYTGSNWLAGYVTSADR